MWQRPAIRISISALSLAKEEECHTTKYHEQTPKMSWAQPVYIVHIVPQNMFHKQARDIILRQDVDPCLTLVWSVGVWQQKQDVSLQQSVTIIHVARVGSLIQYM